MIGRGFGMTDGARTRRYSERAPRIEDAKMIEDRRLEISQYTSLEELYNTLEPARASGPRPGVVRMNPARFLERGVVEVIETRAKLSDFGLALVLTPAVGLDCVELKRLVAIEPAPRAKAGGER